MTTIYEPTGVKSIHIEGKWPYQYVKPQSDVKNAKERERYWKLKREKQLLTLPVYEMDVFQRLNYESQSSF